MTDADADAAFPSSWKAEADEVSSGGGRTRLLVVLGSIAALLVIAGVIALVLRNDSEDRVWPAELSGRAEGLGRVNVAAPDVELAADPGVYLWQDFDGWHLWVVNGDGISGVSGTIQADSEVGRGTLAVAGAGALTVEDESFTFDLPAEPELVGIDFNPGFFTSELVIELQGPDGPIDPALVTLGRRGSTDAVPVVIEKVERPAPTE